MKQSLVPCSVTKQMIPFSKALPVAMIRPGVVELIKKAHPKWNPQGYVSQEIVVHFRRDYIEKVLELERGELSKLDREVLKSMSRHETLAQDIEAKLEKKLTFGQRMADRIAEFGGSWRFIIIFLTFLLVWVCINLYLLSKPFDPYPFIFLNLFLSLVAALQAPVIMMSQNRKEAKDRLRAENDYKINLKAELEIRHLHEKMDNLMKHQWQRLLQIQQQQMDLIEEKRSSKRKPRS